MFNNKRKLGQKKLVAFIMVLAIMLSMASTVMAGSLPLNFVGACETVITNGTSSTGTSIINSTTVPAGATFKLIFDKNVVSDAVYNGTTVYANNQACVVLQTSSGTTVSSSIFRLGTGAAGDPERQYIFVDPTSNLTSGQQYKIVISPNLIANNGVTMGYQQVINFTVQ